jgi:long-chain fatty acid transport protein
VIPALRLSLDVERTYYSDVASVGNALGNLFACPTAGAGGNDLGSCLGGNNGAGFGWRDMTTVKLGAEWVVNPTWTVRGGISDGDQPIPESEVLFNILAPGVIERHVTAGVTRKSAGGGEWTFALMYALNNEVSGVNAFDPTQTISLEMDQWEAEVGYSWRF